MLSKKNNCYQGTIFLALTGCFCAGNLLFIPYSLFIYVLFPGFKPTSFRFKMKKKI